MEKPPPGETASHRTQQRRAPRVEKPGVQPRGDDGLGRGPGQQHLLQARRARGLGEEIRLGEKRLLVWRLLQKCVGDVYPGLYGLEGGSVGDLETHVLERLSLQIWIGRHASDAFGREGSMAVDVRGEKAVWGLTLRHGAVCRE